ncbi:MAG: 50S ribosomal protein L35 [Actinobacteria bacterium]|nr:50S ribosomal protein L35 [Cyanobacteriota bacterium]MCL5772247.1 50S ribosomal protein L35 [Actinomycetota bacterium]
MPKLKTNKAAAKRFRVTGTGKIMRQKAYKSHILTKKNADRKRELGQPALVDRTNLKTVKKLLGK